ncbi:MAG: hypothetical protein LBI86_03925 [Treponema sp.]|jgi:hypothetical protein|nr:hypothetical protein [Treponema sp.]
MNIKTCILIVSLFIPAVFPVFSASLEELAGPERALVLRSGELISQVQLKNPRPALLPNHAAVRALTGEIERSLNPGIIVETLSLYKKSGGTNAGGAVSGSWTGEERRDLYNEALTISSLAGIQYYSATRKTMRTFYETSVVINNPEAKQPLPDPAYAVPPENIVIYARQKDLTFGDNIYRYEYRTGTDFLIFTQENLTAMNIGIINAVGKNRLRSVVAVLDAGDSLLVYAASMAKASAFPGLGERIGNSFTNRTKAILQWFTDKADKVFG